MWGDGGMCSVLPKKLSDLVLYCTGRAREVSMWYVRYRYQVMETTASRDCDHCYEAMQQYIGIKKRRLETESGCGVGMWIVMRRE